MYWLSIMEVWIIVPHTAMYLYVSTQWHAQHTHTHTVAHTHAQVVTPYMSFTQIIIQHCVTTEGHLSQLSHSSFFFPAELLRGDTVGSQVTVH